MRRSERVLCVFLKITELDLNIIGILLKPIVFFHRLGHDDESMQFGMWWDVGMSGLKRFRW